MTRNPHQPCCSLDSTFSGLGSTLDGRYCFSQGTTSNHTNPTYQLVGRPVILEKVPGDNYWRLKAQANRGTKKCFAKLDVETSDTLIATMPRKQYWTMSLGPEMEVTMSVQRQITTSDEDEFESIENEAETGSSKSN